MKKTVFVLTSLLAQMGFAQSLIVGNQSISVQDFKTKYKIGLESKGIDATIKSTVDFMLLQQLAIDKKADTLTSFRNVVDTKIKELQQSQLIPDAIYDPILAKYMADNQFEYKIQIFNLTKEAGDINNYNKIYNDVKSGAITMDNAIETYVKEPVKPGFIKAGTIDSELFTELTKTAVGGYTKLFDSNGSIVFAKLVEKRPTLGYVTFGTLSYPNDFNSDETQAKIYTALNSGKKFEEVIKEFGSNDHERKNGGLVLGSPVLPDEIYNELKGKKDGYFTKTPHKVEKKFFIFNIYHVEPYKITKENNAFFKEEIKRTTYANDLNNQLLTSIMVAPDYKTFADLTTIKKSYNDFKNFKNLKAPLFQYKNKTESIADFKTVMDKNYQNLDKISASEWSNLVDFQIKNMVYDDYVESFANRPEVQAQLSDIKQNLYSQYIFNDYIKAEVAKNEKNQKDYYNQHKDQFQWEKSAKSRVAIISDPKVVNDVKKQMSNPKNWESLKAKYDKKLNDNNKILVSFEEGKVPATAEVFTEMKVPYKIGVHQTKVKDRDVIVAVDELIPEQSMTFEEAKDSVKDTLTEKMLKETIESQKNKLKVEIQPGFIEDLSKTFKK